MKRLISVKEGCKNEIILSSRDITEDYATRTCAAYGWTKGSAAWQDLASDARVTKEFLLSHAQTMHPKAKITWVSDNNFSNVITATTRGPVTLACQRSERNTWEAMMELEYDRARYRRALDQIGFKLAGTPYDDISKRTLAVFKGETFDGEPIQAHHVGW